MIKRLWNEKEVAILIYGYLLIGTGIYTKKEVVNEMSKKFRKNALMKKLTIDEKYRNNSGISMKLGNIDYLFSNGKSGFKNYSVLEYNVYKMFLNNKRAFDELLLIAIKEYNFTWDVYL